MNMGFIFVSEILQGGEHGIRAGLTETAQGAAFDHIAQLFQQFDIPGSPRPWVIFFKTSSILLVPSRHGVHLPHDSSWMKSMKNRPCPPCRSDRS